MRWEGNPRTMVELPSYVVSRVADDTVPSVRTAWGNWGCLMASVFVVAVLVWFLAAFLLHSRGEDWRAWLIVGPSATLVIVVMITVTYGLAAGSRRERADMPVQYAEHAQDPQDEPGTMSVQALQHLDLAYDHEHRGEFTYALRECRRAVRLDPGYSEAHNCRSRIRDAGNGLSTTGHPNAPQTAHASATLPSVETLPPLVA